MMGPAWSHFEMGENMTIKPMTRGALLLASVAALSACTPKEMETGVKVDVHVPTPEMLEAANQRIIAQGKVPDSPGTGPNRVIRHVLDSLPDEVVYQPADLSALGTTKMPVYLFGNGACSTDATKSRHHLIEIASHGYLVIVPGGIYGGPGVEMTSASIMSRDFKADSALLGEAIDWAIAENSSEGSPFYGKIDTGNVVMSGYSCGGTQALKYAGDPRISSFVIMNSGIFPENYIPMDGMSLSKRLLDKIKVPILYVTGGPEDVAYTVARDDFSRIRNAPVALIDTEATHSGTYGEPNGGRVAQAVVHWLEWQTRGDAESARWFVGADCKLCTDPQWTVQWRNLDMLKPAL